MRGTLIAMPLSPPALLATSLLSCRSIELETGGGCTLGIEILRKERQRVRADHVIIATPAHRVPQLRGNGIDARALAPIAETDHAPVATVTLGFRRAEVDHPLDGFGFLVADGESRSILGALFTSSMFPGRCPSDEVLVTCFVGGTSARGLAALPTASLVPLIQADLRALIGLRGYPTFVEHTQWPRAIPQFTVAHSRVLDAARALESACAGISFAGSWRTGVSVGDCITGGRFVAQRALAHVTR